MFITTTVDCGLGHTSVVLAVPSLDHSPPLLRLSAPRLALRMIFVGNGDASVAFVALLLKEM